MFRGTICGLLNLWQIIKLDGARHMRQKHVSWRKMTEIKSSDVFTASKVTEMLPNMWIAAAIEGHNTITCD